MLLDACETWTVYKRHTKRLNHFHLSCLRKHLKIRWRYKIQDPEYGGPEEGKDAKRTYSIKACAPTCRMDWPCLMGDYQRKFSMQNFRKGSAHKVAKTNATKTPFKPHCRLSIFKLSSGNSNKVLKPHQKRSRSV